MELSHVCVFECVNEADVQTEFVCVCVCGCVCVCVCVGGCVCVRVYGCVLLTGLCDWKKEKRFFPRFEEPNSPEPEYFPEEGTVSHSFSHFSLSHSTPLSLSLSLSLSHLSSLLKATTSSNHMHPSGK